jgi:anti-anti-sigma regulatory factor
MAAIPLGPIGTDYVLSSIGSEVAGFEFVGGHGMWRLLGELDIANRDEFADALRVAVRASSECVIDMRDTEFVGVGELRLICEAAREHAAVIRLVNVPAVVQLCWRAGNFADARSGVELAR